MKNKSCKAELKYKILVLLEKPKDPYAEPCKFICASLSSAFSAMQFSFSSSGNDHGLDCVLSVL